MASITCRHSFLCRNISFSSHESAFSISLQNCSHPSSLVTGASLHAHTIKTSLLTSVFLCNHLLNMYSRCHLLSSTLSLFNEMPQKNAVSWSSLLLAHLHHGFHDPLISLLCKMQRSGSANINEFSIVAALQASSSSPGNQSLAFQLLCMATRLGFISNMHVNNAFLSTLTRQGKVVEAAEAFDKFSYKDTVSWNTMISGCSSPEIPHFWHRMHREGVIPDVFSFAIVLTGIASLPTTRMGVQVHGQLIKSGHGCEICVGNSLADMYLKTHSLVDGSKAFNEMRDRDVVSWTQMASGFLSCGEPGGALGAIVEMKSTGIKPNKFTLATAFSACASLPSLPEGMKAHVWKIKLGNEVDVCTENALLDMYTKCGSMAAACTVFRFMGERTVVSWTTMITGYTLNADPRKAVEVFEEMKAEGVEPNYITFICVLYACSQGGFLVEGWRHFSSMGSEHGVLPGDDHYICMVDLLCRTECLKEAEELILRMPFKPSVLVWQILLNACLVKGDGEGAVRAGKHALEMDRRNPLTYILLSNMLAGLNRWEGVGALRGVMGSRNVKKTPGSSWIEMNVNRVISLAIEEKRRVGAHN